LFSLKQSEMVFEAAIDPPAPAAMTAVRAKSAARTRACTGRNLDFW
jgi:hypothetical protein